MGECTKATAFEIMDHFFDQGGNMIDTSPNYQNEESEKWIGEWLEARGIRDQLVIATKFTTNYQVYKGYDGRINSNFGGNSSKCLALTVESSLKNLKTSYIDLLYIHWWDHVTSVQELMISLNQLIQRGKVLYLGASDCPAWFVAKCNQYARDHGMKGFVVYQGQWSAANRSFESDILSLCKEDGMAIAPWGALGSGEFMRQSQEKTAGRTPVFPNKRAAAVSAVLERVADNHNTLITSVAMAYVMHKAPYVFPIVGCRTVEHLKGNIEALGISLTEDETREIEDAAPFELGFPLNMIGRYAEECWSMNQRGHFDYVPRPQSIKLVPTP
jgi:aryl-alcohol dehydrogenase-like predicted oxidoreductase